MTRRRKHGVTLTYVNGDWVTVDGSAGIGRVRAIEGCEGPHPWRYRDDLTGRVVQTYCAGGDEHDRQVGWGFSPRPSGLTDDLYPTLDEAHAALAAFLAQGRRTGEADAAEDDRGPVHIWVVTNHPRRTRCPRN